jgi:hypothetical protein
VKKRNFLKTLIFAIPLLISCSKDDETVISPTAEFYFFGEIDNEIVLFEEKDTVEFIGGQSNFSREGLLCSGSFKTGLYRVDRSGGIRLTLQITFYNVAEAKGECNQDDINDIFFSELNPGDYNFSFNTPGITTVGIHYYDENQVSWSSIYKDQSQQNFLTVLKSESIGTDKSGKKLQKIEGVFSGYLYKLNFQTGDVVDSVFVNNGEFIYKFISE